MNKINNNNDFNFKISNHNGKLVQLLDLISSKKIDINKIDFKDLISQYKEFLSCNKDNLNEIGENLLISSYLLELKSKELLPSLNNDEIDSEYDLELKEELLKRMLIFAKYKKITPILEDALYTSNLCHNKKPDYDKNINYEFKKIDHKTIINSLEDINSRNLVLGSNEKKIKINTINVEEVSRDFSLYLEENNYINKSLFSIFSEMKRHTYQNPLQYFINLFSCSLEWSSVGKIKISNNKKNEVVINNEPK